MPALISSLSERTAISKVTLTRRALGIGAGALAAHGLAAAVLRGQPRRQRLAVVGTGIRGISTWGRDLVERWSDVVDIVGLCDANPGRLEHAHRTIGADCPTFTEVEPMLDATRPERLIVCTVDSTHDDMIVAALERGVDVLTEKPLTTDRVKLDRIVAAARASKRPIVVAHNYRYAPHRLRIKELLAEGRIGTVTSLDFHWYLDVRHGAAYFRRWHGKERNSGGLFVHKACHHFDVVNWWLDTDPEEVYAQADLRHYGANGPFRHSHCRPCPHQARCAYYWDITQSPELVALYVANEHHDGYLRDGCVYDPAIDIFDHMAAQVRYKNGALMSYSCTTYSPYEGYRIAFNGTRGRLEAWIKESQPWEEPAYDELRLTTSFGASELIRVPHHEGGHGGGDDRMRDRLFRTPDAPDPHGQGATLRDGAMAVLVGFAARQSARSGQPVKIGDLTDLELHAERPRVDI